MRGLCPRAPGIYRFPARMASPAGAALPPQPLRPAESALGFHPWRALSSAQVTAIIAPAWVIQGICARTLTKA